MFPETAVLQADSKVKLLLIFKLKISFSKRSPSFSEDTSSKLTFPSSTNCKRQTAAKPFVVEKTLTMVSSCQVVFSSSESTPPQRSITFSPSISTVIAAPLSNPLFIFFSNNSLAGLNLRDLANSCLKI